MKIKLDKDRSVLGDIKAAAKGVKAQRAQGKQTKLEKKVERRVVAQLKASGMDPKVLAKQAGVTPADFVRELAQQEIQAMQYPAYADPLAYMQGMFAGPDPATMAYVTGLVPTPDEMMAADLAAQHIQLPPAGEDGMRSAQDVADATEAQLQGQPAEAQPEAKAPAAEARKNLFAKVDEPHGSEETAKEGPPGLQVVDSEASSTSAPPRARTSPLTGPGTISGPLGTFDPQTGSAGPNTDAFGANFDPASWKI